MKASTSARKGTFFFRSVQKAIADVFMKVKASPQLPCMISVIKRLMPPKNGTFLNNQFQKFTAAVNFSNWLFKNVPFFGGINRLITDIMHGNWGDAFTFIKTSAIAFWTDLKKKVPFLADVEAFITAFKAHKWSDMW